MSEFTIVTLVCRFVAVGEFRKWCDWLQWCPCPKNESTQLICTVRFSTRFQKGRWPGWRGYQLGFVETLSMQRWDDACALLHPVVSFALTHPPQQIPYLCSQSEFSCKAHISQSLEEIYFRASCLALDFFLNNYFPALPLLYRDTLRRLTVHVCFNRLRCCQAPSVLDSLLVPWRISCPTNWF